MKNYKVIVNGTAYEISVEEISESEVKTQNAPVESKPATSVSTASAGGEKVESPMPGTILDVKVKDGQAVKAGDVLVILEAMKMENEIMAPCDGTVVGLSVQNGATVESGAVICSIQ